MDRVGKAHSGKIAAASDLEVTTHESSGDAFSSMGIASFRITCGLPSSSIILAFTPYTVDRFSSVMTSPGVPTSKILPSCIRMISSANLAVMLMSWLIIIVRMPFLMVRSFSILVTSSWCLMSKLDVGSSRRRILDSWTRTLALTLMAVMTAGIVSFVGIIGFVGLVCPHIVRLVAGSDNRFVIPISMALSALIVIVSDYISMMNSSLAVGVVISAIGAPLFFILIVMSKTKGKGAIF